MRIKILSTETAVTSTNTSSVDLRRVDNFSIQGVTSATGPAAATFTAATTDICTAVAHGYLTGLKTQVSTTTTLPAGLSAVTDYFVIKIDADTFYLATSYANALAGTRVDITNTGSGTHTITPTAIAGCTLKVQGSNDNTNFVDISSASANVTAAGSVLISIAPTSYRWARAVLTLTAGQPAIIVTASGRERDIA